MIQLATLPLDTYSVLQSIRTNATAQMLSSVGSISSILAAILCGVSLIVSIHNYIRGKEDLFHGLLYPLVLLCLVCQFNTLVLSPIDTICQRVASSIKGAVKVSDKEYITHWGKASQKMSELTQKEADKAFVEDIQDISRDKGVSRILKEIGLTLKRTVYRQLGIATLSFASVLAGGLFLLSKVVFFCQGILSALLLALLSILGPLAFALGILPSGRNIITRWIGYYINLSLWPVVGLMVLKINLLVSDSFVGIASSSGAGLSLEWMMIAVNTCAVVLTLCVPRLCSMISLAPEAEAIRSKLSSSILSASSGAVLKAKDITP